MWARIQQMSDCFGELWGKYKIWIIFLMMAYLFDTLTTIHFMTKSSINLEFHPLVRYSALLIGPVTGTILSAFCYKAVVSIFLALYLKRFRFWILLVPTISSTLAGIYNLHPYSF